MKRLTIFLLTVLSLNFAYGQARVDTVEAHRLFEEGRRLYRDYKYYDALQKYRQADIIFKRQSCELMYAQCLMWQVRCYKSLYAYQHKVPLMAEEALDIFRKYKSYKNIARVYRNLGEYFWYVYGKIDKALLYCHRAVNIYKKNGQAVSLPVAWLWNSIGLANVQQGSYSEAIRCYNKSYQMLQKLIPKGDKRFAIYFRNRGECFKRVGETEMAIRYTKHSIKYNNSLYGSYIAIGDIYKKQNKLNLAEEYYQKALHVIKRRYKNSHQSIASVYVSLCSLYMLKKDYLTALKLTQKGLKYVTKNFHDTLDIYHHTSVKNNLSSNAYFLVHRAKAFSLLSGDLKNLKASLYNYQLYDSIRIKAKINSFRSNDYFVQKAYVNAIQVCQRLYAQTQDKKYQRLAFYFAQRSHANTLAKSLQARRAKTMVHLPDSLISQEMYLKQQRAYYQQKILTVKDSLQKKAYQDSVFRMVRSQDKLSKVYAQKFPKYFRLRYQSKPITLEQLQQKLSKNTIVLSYVWGKEQSHVLAITHNDLNVYTLPAQAKVTTALNAYYDALQQEQRLPNFAKKSYQAYQYLFAPVEKLLQDKQQVIVANPTLLSLPLEALVTQPYQPAWQSFGQLPYFIRKHNLSYHYSTTLWRQSQDKAVSITKKKLRFAAFAPFSGGKGKVMTTRANEGLLPESKAEVSTVYNFFKQKNYNAVAYLSKAATRREFLNQAAKSDILHIASHSTANLRETRLAKVHFAPQAQADSKYLYAESIYHLPLKARLVVLSSCDSGVGKFVAGEGVESLARGFLHAGAQSVISSLWEADDAYTKKLMILFYDNALFHQDTYVTALSHAKRQLMRKEPQLHPKYWSCFILIGN